MQRRETAPEAHRAWFRVTFEYGAGDEDGARTDFGIVRAVSAAEACRRVVDAERFACGELGAAADCSAESIRAVACEQLPEHATGVVDG